MLIFVSKLDIFAYKSLLVAAMLPKFPELLEYYCPLLPASFWHCDLIDEVTRGHERSRNWTFAYKSVLSTARFAKLSDMLLYHIFLLCTSLGHFDLTDEVTRGHQRSRNWLFAHKLLLTKG